MEIEVRNYQTQKNINRKLRDFFYDMRQRGDLILPAERSLCEMLQCNRLTLRHVLKAHEHEGMIIKKGKGRALSMQTVGNAKPLGSISFVSAGFNMVANPAWNKLWQKVQYFAEKANIASELLLLKYGQDNKAVINTIKRGAEIVIFAEAPNLQLQREILKLSDKTIIVTDEYLSQMVNNAVCLDNYEVGKLAAQKFFEHGYKKPAFIYKEVKKHGKTYIPFVKRGMGFADGCKNYGMSYDGNSEIGVSGETNVAFIVNIIKKMDEIDDRFDAMFIYADNDIEYFYETITRKKRIPEDIGIITVNCSDNASSHDPLISSVGHGTAATAETLLEKIKYILLTGDTNIGRTMIKPVFFNGATLR